MGVGRFGKRLSEGRGGVGVGLGVLRGGRRA